MKKILLRGVVALLAILVTSHYFWKSSGSNEWELKKDEDGIKIWALKTPGSTAEKYRVNMQTKSTLSSIVFLLRDSSSAEEVVGAKNHRMFETIDEPYRFSSYYSYQVEMPFPYGYRDWVILFQYTQERASKILEINIVATPNKIHPVENLVRIKHMNNIWRLTPKADGMVDLEANLDMDMEGPLPGFIDMLVMPDVIFSNFKSIRELLKKEKYKNAKVAYIKELTKEK